MKHLILLLLFVCTGSLAWAQQPIGWASANGGTTGGEGGQTVTASTRTELYNYVGSPAPLIIQVQDTIELNLYEMIPVSGNKTIVGLGHDAAIRYGGLQIEGNNVIVRNLEIFDTYDGDWTGTSHSTDGITVYGAQNVWIDHCWFHACADGLLDIRSTGENNIGDFVTVSYCRFTDHNKVTLVGSSDNNTYNRGHLNVTFHHCWWDGTIGNGVNQRMPRVRFGDVHVLNCYYEEVDSYCIGVNFESDVVVENTYFRNASDPHPISGVGQGIEDPDCVVINNIYEYSNGTQDVNGEAFTPSDHYSYTPDPVMEIPAMVMNAAGQMNPADNIAPVAVDDEVELLNPTALVFIEPVENDTDEDGGDLRIAAVINEYEGEVGIQTNRILYRPPTMASGNDTLLYQLVDTQGGIDTGMVVIINPFATSTEDYLLDSSVMDVFPNPVQKEARIIFRTDRHERVETALYDMWGRKLNAPIVQDNDAVSGQLIFRLRTTGLPAGSYLLQIRQGRRMATQQVIVNN